MPRPRPCSGRGRAQSHGAVCGWGAPRRRWPGNARGIDTHIMHVQVLTVRPTDPPPVDRWVVCRASIRRRPPERARCAAARAPGPLAGWGQAAGHRGRPHQPGPLLAARPRRAQRALATARQRRVPVRARTPCHAAMRSSCCAVSSCAALQKKRTLVPTRAPPPTTLGFARHQAAHLPADRALRQGGPVALTVLCIQRAHPTQWFESTAKGPVYRSTRAHEEHRRRQQQAMQQVERLVAERLQQEEVQRCRSVLGGRSNGGQHDDDGGC